MDVLPYNVRDFSLMELFYVDDFAVYGKSLDEVMERWKRVLEGRGLRVNSKKTRGIQLLHGNITYVLKVDPCNVYGKQVGCNSTKCLKWVQ